MLSSLRRMVWKENRTKAMILIRRFQRKLWALIKAMTGKRKNHIQETVKNERLLDLVMLYESRENNIKCQTCFFLGK